MTVLVAPPIPSKSLTGLLPIATHQPGKTGGLPMQSVVAAQPTVIHMQTPLASTPSTTPLNSSLARGTTPVVIQPIVVTKANDSSTRWLGEKLFHLWEQLEDGLRKMYHRTSSHMARWRRRGFQGVNEDISRVKEQAALILAKFHLRGSNRNPSASSPQRVYDLIERSALFAPVKNSSLRSLKPALQRAIGHTRFFSVPELGGIELAAWYFRAKPGKPTLLVHHGRQCHIGMLGEFLESLRQKGFGVFIYDYPGFGKSEGRPRIDTIHHAAAAARDNLIERGIPANRQILVGHSLGGAVATDLAFRMSQPPENAKTAQSKENVPKATSSVETTSSTPSSQRPGALILINTLSCTDDVLRSHSPEFKGFSWLFQRYPDLLKRFPEVTNFFNLSDKLKVIAKDTPVLVLHANKDSVFPPELGEALYNSAKSGVNSQQKQPPLIRHKQLKGDHYLYKNKDFIENVANEMETFAYDLNATKSQ